MNRGLPFVLLLAEVACTRSAVSGAVRASEGANRPPPSAATRDDTVPPVASAPEPAPGAATLSPAGAVPQTAGLTLEFAPSGISVLRNPTARAYWVLHSSLLQPSRLEIRDAKGNVVPSFDTRAIKKFDNTVEKSAFREVKAGGELPLFDLVVIQQDALWELRWGPFSMTALRPGDYTGVVVFESRVSHYFDAQRGAERELPNVWLGTARSDAVAFRLPLH